MNNLFSEYSYLSYNFPEPQYLGAKFIHRGWIAQFIPDNVHVVLDAFGGSQSIAYLFKQLGKKTITNDFMEFNDKIGKALIENSFKHQLPRSNEPIRCTYTFLRIIVF